ncbi:hypothetical protein DWG18_04730 [Lysobacter sp. TY2-98]|uniref:hypothetical protein n=1 Tax=Lysobacter sp. TY2-98 TaxID=2290922 RepID=UPI000E203076|nr:hypothetical protein [Lysobacter sp. TY2-98]AXK71662.1 hypothetical protein DWG18_04730 [Lysobacter sp. TY2-98]
MAVTDARISTSLPSHPKTKKLVKRLGIAACWHLVRLYLFAASNRSGGSLAGMTDEDIELAVDWLGGDGEFVNALKAVGFLDGAAGRYEIHDWADHNPWVAGAEVRSAKARWNAVKRHHGEDQADRQVPEWASLRASSNAVSNAASTVVSSTAALHDEQSSNAPSPSPSPNPNPNPNPNNTGASAPKTATEDVIDSNREKPAPTPKLQAVSIEELVAAGVDEQHARDWLGVRKAKGVPLTRTAWQSTVAEASKAGITSAEAVKVAAENGWRGFRAIYLTGYNGRSRVGSRHAPYDAGPEVTL